VRFEGVFRYDRRIVYGAPRKNNETPVGELQYEPVLRYRWYVEPVIEDDLERIIVDVVPLQYPDTIPPEDVVQRIIAKYEFTAQ
jgi:hypothetical protein